MQQSWGQGRSAVLDLGCGPGTLARQQSTLSTSVVGLDLAGPCLGTAANVVGDALFPPFTRCCADVVLAGNLFRHLLPADGQGKFLSRWLRLLRPGGFLFILEDQPCSHDDVPVAGGWANYTAFQEFLARLDPQHRRPLMSLDGFLDWLERHPAGQGVWDSGLQENSLPAEREPVVAMLVGDGGRLAPEVRDLVKSIQRAGLSYGKYWWAAFRAEE